MEQPTTIGIDLAKTVFQIHGVDLDGVVILRRKLRRNQVLDFFAGLKPCLVGMEACAGAHYWARELQALGHEVRIMPPSYVKPYVKRGKTDQADAEAICEAVTRPTMQVKPQACLRHDAGEVGRAAGGPAGPQDAGLPRPPAHAAGEHDPGASVRIWHRRGQGDPQCRAVARGGERSASGRCGTTTSRSAGRAGSSVSIRRRSGANARQTMTMCARRCARL